MQNQHRISVVGLDVNALFIFFVSYASRPPGLDVVCGAQNGQSPRGKQRKKISPSYGADPDVGPVSQSI